MTEKTAIVDPLINSTKEFFDNPYPSLKRVREEAPVFWSEAARVSRAERVL